MLFCSFPHVLPLMRERRRRSSSFSVFRTPSHYRHLQVFVVIPLSPVTTGLEAATLCRSTVDCHLGILSSSSITLFMASPPLSDLSRLLLFVFCLDPCSISSPRLGEAHFTVNLWGSPPALAAGGAMHRHQAADLLCC